MHRCPQALISANRFRKPGSFLRIIPQRSCAAQSLSPSPGPTSSSFGARSPNADRTFVVFAIVDAVKRPLVFVEVAFPIPLNRTFHYETGDPPIVGARVSAPFGKKGSKVGYVVGQTNEKPS